MSVTECARKWFECKRKSEEAADEVKRLNAEWDEAEKALLESMVEEGVPSISIEGFGLFSMVTKNYLSVNAANKPGFYEYLKASGNGGLLKEEVNSKTLTAFLKTHLDELIKDRIDKGLDNVEAREDALKFLNAKGASYFSDKSISFRKG